MQKHVQERRPEGLDLLRGHLLLGQVDLLLLVVPCSGLRIGLGSGLARLSKRLMDSQQGGFCEKAQVWRFKGQGPVNSNHKQPCSWPGRPLRSGGRGSLGAAQPVHLLLLVDLLHDLHEELQRPLPLLG